MMQKNLKGMGKEADVACLERLVGTLSNTGGSNRNISGCWEKNSGGMGARASDARK